MSEPITLNLPPPGESPWSTVVTSTPAGGYTIEAGGVKVTAPNYKSAINLWREVMKDMHARQQQISGR